MAAVLAAALRIVVPTCHSGGLGDAHTTLHGHVHNASTAGPRADDGVPAAQPHARVGVALETLGARLSGTVENLAGELLRPLGGADAAPGLVQHAASPSQLLKGKAPPVAS